MTEEEWLTCSDPSSLISSPLIRNSQRKRYLLGVACCRRVWQFCSQPRMCEAVELIERLAETGVTEAEVEKAREWLSWGGPDAVAAAANQTCYALFGAGIHSTDLSLDLSSCLRNACCAVGYDVGYRGGEAAWGEP